MGFLQALFGGVVTIMSVGSVFFVAYKALTIGNDVAEMKELLRQMQSGATGPKPLSSYPLPIEAYDDEPTPEKPFVLPPPISRRLDAERSVRPDA